MNNLNTHLQKKPSFREYSGFKYEGYDPIYQTKKKITVKVKELTIPGIIKSVSNTTKKVENTGEEFRIAMVQVFCQNTQTLQTYAVKILNLFYETFYEELRPESEVEIKLEYNELSQKTHSQVLAPSQVLSPFKF